MLTRREAERVRTGLLGGAIGTSHSPCEVGRGRGISIGGGSFVSSLLLVAIADFEDGVER